jgi:DNA topoisomerase-1
MELRFRAKGGFRRVATIDVPPVVRLIRECAALPGSHVFQYVDADGKIRAITATEVNDYLKSLTGEEFTAKDFRTWKASTYAIAAIFAADKKDDVTATPRKRTARDVVCQTAQMLSNTPAVCRNYYIHPGLLESYEAGRFAQEVGTTMPRPRQFFTAEEQLLARFLRRWKPTLEE